MTYSYDGIFVGLFYEHSLLAGRKGNQSMEVAGLFLTVWVKSDLMEDVRNMEVSCVGRGLMGYLGNKDSISISMSLHQTSFCFICGQFTSGQEEGDELRRNINVMEILRKTRFPRAYGMGDENSPQTILDHAYTPVHLNSVLGELRLLEPTDIILPVRAAKSGDACSHWKGSRR